MQVEDEQWRAKLSERIRADRDEGRGRGAAWKEGFWDLLSSPNWIIVGVVMGAGALRGAARQYGPDDWRDLVPYFSISVPMAATDLPAWLPTWEVLLTFALIWYAVIQILGVVFSLLVAVLAVQTVDRSVLRAFIVVGALAVVASVATTVAVMNGTSFGVASDNEVIRELTDFELTPEELERYHLWQKSNGR